jgi:hypothetical protein
MWGLKEPEGHWECVHGGKAVSIDDAAVEYENLLGPLA